MAKRFFTFLVMAGTLALANARAGGAVARFDTAEIVLRSAFSFNASQGTPNPFTAVDLTARVVAPSGRVYTVPGFFDGDGASGTIGNVFKIRVYADEPGTWQWTANSNTAGLHGQSGTFYVSGTLAGVFGGGPVVENPTYPRTLKHQYGEPVYLLGKFLDVAAPWPLQFSHTMFSEQLSEANRQAMLDRHLGMKLNKINVYLANRGDYDGIATTPWVGIPSSNEKQRFDLTRWRMYERWVLKMRAAGVVSQLWFFADDSSFGYLPEADRHLLIRYGMARLSGYVNTMFTLALEWQEDWTTTQVGASMSYLQGQNPWARLASVHGVTGDFSFPSAAWADYLDTQAGNEAGHAAVHAHGLANRLYANKPLIQEEFGLGDEDISHRQKAWAAFTAGAAGSGTGAFLAHLATFAAQVDFERMAPADGLALSGNAYVLAEAGTAYVLYLHGGGTVRLDLRGVSGTFNIRWYDPRTGVFQPAGNTTGGQERSFTAPPGGDWVLHLLKSGSASTSDPNRALNRAEMASAVVRAIHGQSFVPAPAVGFFTDVPASFWAAPFIEHKYHQGLTAGCATNPLRFCPDSLLSRAEAAVLLLRIRHGRTYFPPPATGQVFADVPANHWALRWIEQLYAEGLTGGCATAPRLYCPGDPVTAGQLDLFLGRVLGNP